MQNNIIIIGAAGSIGSRWVAVAKYLNCNITALDTKLSAAPFDYLQAIKHTKQVIIATATNTHLNIISNILQQDKTVRILCEKPLCASNQNVPMLDCDVQIVNNWAYVLPYELKLQSHDISYKYFQSGKEDKFSNFFQPIAFAKTFYYNEEYPIFECSIDNTLITKEDFDFSYIRLLKKWLNKEQAAWSLSDYTAAHNIVKENIKTTSTL